MSSQNIITSCYEAETCWSYYYIVLFSNQKTYIFTIAISLIFKIFLTPIIFPETILNSLITLGSL